MDPNSLQSPTHTSDLGEEDQPPSSSPPQTTSTQPIGLILFCPGIFLINKATVIFPAILRAARAFLRPFTYLFALFAFFFIAESDLECRLRDADMAAQGLYASPKRSFFPSTDRKHLLSLLNVSGYSRKGDPNKLTDDCRKGLRELDYFLFQDGLPSYLDRADRYDRMPGNPVDRLFAALPTPEEDDWGFKDPESAAAHDRRIVLALWPYANSSLEDILSKTDDAHAHDYWWMTRFAFSLWERSDLSIRCSFTQLLGQLAISQLVPIDPNARTTTPGHECTVTDGSAPCPGEAYINKHAWLRYARWAHRGKRDSDADIKGRRDQVCGSNVEDALGCNKCTHCGLQRGKDRDSPNRKLLYCTGCYVSWFHHLRRVYCSEECRKADWTKHFYDCQRRKHFFRAVFILKEVAIKYMKETYSGFAAESVDVELKGPWMNKIDRTGVPRSAVSPAAYDAGHWVGQPVFPAGNNTLPKKKPKAESRKILAWDSGDNLYYHLQHIIDQIIGPHCDMIIETKVFIRNAKSIAVLSSDIYREGFRIQVAKGKDPMFWPHPVLNCRLKGSKPDDIFIIDLLGEKFGFEERILPFDVFIKTRHASCVSSRVLRDMPPHWSPRGQEGLITCRDLVAFAWVKGMKEYFAKHLPRLQGLWQVAKLKEDKWNANARLVLALTNSIFEDNAKKIRDQDVHRLYLVHNPNPYSHEFAIGVTNDADECELYKNIWMDRRTYDVVVKNKLSEQNQILSPGSETLRLVALWVDRVKKYGQKHPFNSVKLLSPQMARHHNICATHTQEEYRAMEKAWLTHSGIAKEDIDRFYRKCDQIFGNLLQIGPVTPERFCNFMVPLSAFDVVRYMTKEDAKAFVAVGAFITTPSAREFIKEIQSSLLDGKK
ncbi:hypothetical protein EsH8_I_001505 [Colletotrichum jinshuiense]